MKCCWQIFINIDELTGKMIIAVTGYVGAGKSTTAEFFRQYGFDIINADELGHTLLKNHEIEELLKHEFGMSIVGRDFSIDRKKLSETVFNNPDKLTILNRIIHPHLKQAIKNNIKSSADRIIVDIALFKELNLNDVVQKVILVQTDITKIYERLSSRYTKREIVNIMNHQEISENPDFIIENNGTKEDLRLKVEDVAKKMGLAGP
jgi:dephospho-CoA kinase